MKLLISAFSFVFLTQFAQGALQKGAQNLVVLVGGQGGAYGYSCDFLPVHNTKVEVKLEPQSVADEEELDKFLQEHFCVPVNDDPHGSFNQNEQPSPAY